MGATLGATGANFAGVAKSWTWTWTWTWTHEKFTGDDLPKIANHGAPVNAP